MTRPPFGTPLRPTRARAATLAGFGTMLVHAVAFAQSAAPAPGAATTPPNAPPITTPLGAYRLPLVREGSVLSRVEGDLAQDPDEKLWLFRPIQPEPGGLRREFALLPSPVLEDMLRTMRLSPSPVEFEMTGRVFIYKGRNFLLAELAPPIVRFDRTEAGGTTPPAGERAIATPSGEAKFVPPTATGDDDDAIDAAVDALERRLEERIGRAPAQPVPDNRPRARDDAPRADAPVASGTRLVRRAGRLARDPQSGAWRFVPTQSTGRGDASLELMPCQMLERLERDAREGDASPEILISGTVHAYEGRSYLLPSGYRRTREARGIGS